MVSDDEPLAVSVPEHHGEACRNRYCLAISDIEECVVTSVDCDVAINANVLLAERDPGIRALRGIIEILGDCCRIRSNRLCGRAPKYGVRVVRCSYARWITTIVCSAPGRSRSCHFILASGSNNTSTRGAGG